MRLTAAIYRALVMVRHPEAIRFAFRGVDYDHLRNLRKPWLLSMDIRTVLDVGANTGQFARLIHEALPRARIYSFEPLPDCFERLLGALPSDADFHPLNYGLGDVSGEQKMRRCIHTPSSSFLPMNPVHHQSFPESAAGDSSVVSVTMRRLDAVRNELRFEGGVLLKLDVQGYEDRVLAGAQETLKEVAVVIMETSFIPFYDGQLLFDDLYALMRSLGFTYWGSLQQYYHPCDGRVIMADSFFIRPTG